MTASPGAALRPSPGPPPAPLQMKCEHCTRKVGPARSSSGGGAWAAAGGGGRPGRGAGVLGVAPPEAGQGVGGARRRPGALAPRAGGGSRCAVLAPGTRIGRPGRPSRTRGRVSGRSSSGANWIERGRGWLGAPGAAPGQVSGGAFGYLVVNVTAGVMLRLSSSPCTRPCFKIFSKPEKENRKQTNLYNRSGQSQKHLSSVDYGNHDQNMFLRGFSPTSGLE